MKKTVVIAVLAGIALYALAGFLLAPAFLKRELEATVADRTASTVAVEQVSVNPFTLGVALRNFRLDKPADQLALSVARMDAQVHVASLLKRTWIIRILAFDEPRLAVQVAGRDGRWLARLTDALANTAATLAASVDADLARLRVSRGELRITTDPAGAEPSGSPLELADLQLRIDNLDAAPSERSDFALSASVSGSGHLDGSGWLTREPAALEAAVAVSGLDLAALSDDLDLGGEDELASGQLQADVRVDYQRGAVRLDVDFEIRDVKIADASGVEPVFSVTVIGGSGGVIDTSSRPASLEVARLESPYLSIERGPGGQIRLPPWLLAWVPGTANDAAPKRIEVAGGRVHFTDLSLTPLVQINTHQINGTLSQLGVGSETTAALAVQGKTQESGFGQLSATWLPSALSRSASLDLVLRDIDLALLSPYLVGIAGREITSGGLSLELDCQVTDQKLDLDNQLVIKDLVLGRRPETPGATGDLPLDFATALLTDDNGHTSLSIPVPSSWIDGGFRAVPVLRQAFTDFVSGLTDAPFAVFAALTGRPADELSSVDFRAGSAAIAPPVAARLADLGRALAQRPALGLDIIPSYDAVADRDALARQQMRLHIALATSAGPPGQATQRTLLFTDEKVQAVLDEFATTRLRLEQLATISTRFANRDEPYYQAIFEALVANEAVSNTAVKSLARYRAQSIVDQLVGAGIDGERLTVADQVTTVAAVQGAVAIGLQAWGPLPSHGETGDAAGTVQPVPGLPNPEPSYWPAPGPELQ